MFKRFFRERLKLFSPPLWVRPCTNRCKARTALAITDLAIRNVTYETTVFLKRSWFLPPPPSKPTEFRLRASNKHRLCDFYHFWSTINARPIQPVPIVYEHKITWVENKLNLWIADFHRLNECSKKVENKANQIQPRNIIAKYV